MEICLLFVVFFRVLIVFEDFFLLYLCVICFRFYMFIWFKNGCYNIKYRILEW